MRCSNCNNEVEISMKYCPYCSYKINGKNKMTIENKIKIIIILIVILVIIIFSNKIKHDKEVDNILSNIFEDGYYTILVDTKFKDQGIYQSLKDDYVYYIDLNKEGLFSSTYKLYEIGYVKHEIIEKFFPDSIYFYRKTAVVGVPSELKIALEASSEEELIKKYSDSLYKLIKETNNDKIILVVYYNDSLKDIETTYDKLFLMEQYREYNVTMAKNMGKGYGNYTFYYKEPYDLLNVFFSEESNLSDNMKKAVIENRNVQLEISDVEDLAYEKFVEKLKYSFEE